MNRDGRTEANEDAAAQPLPVVDGEVRETTSDEGMAFIEAQRGLPLVKIDLAKTVIIQPKGRPRLGLMDHLGAELKD